MSENISLSTYPPGVFVGGRGVIYCGSFFGDRSSRTSGGKAAELEKYGSLSPRSSDIPYLQRREGLEQLRKPNEFQE